MPALKKNSAGIFPKVGKAAILENLGFVRALHWLCGSRVSPELGLERIAIGTFRRKSGSATFQEASKHGIPQQLRWNSQPQFEIVEREVFSESIVEKQRVCVFGGQRRRGVAKT